MEVVVLPPQDILKRHHNNQRRLISPNKPRRNSNPNPSSTNQTSRSTRRRRSSNSPPKVGPHPLPTGPTGQIRILRRGEDIPAPKPEMARPEVVWPIMGPMIGGFYAGSACVTSPAPSELPLPAFFTRSCGLSMVSDDDVDNNQKIASDLRRVLKLF